MVYYTALQKSLHSY